MVHKCNKQQQRLFLNGNFLPYFTSLYVITYQVIQIHQLLPLQWQLHAHCHLASYVCPKEMLIGVHVTSIVITLTKSLETAVVISAYGPLMNDPHKAVKTKNIQDV